MRNGHTHRLGDLQLEIMKLLWKRGASRVADIRQELGVPRFGYTTVRHRDEGRVFHYDPTVTSEEVTRSTTADLVDRVFEGSLADAVSHLLDVREIGLEELDELEQLIQERKKRQTPE